MFTVLKLYPEISLRKFKKLMTWLEPDTSLYTEKNLTVVMYYLSLIFFKSYALTKLSTWGAHSEGGGVQKTANFKTFAETTTGYIVLLPQDKLSAYSCSALLRLLF